MADAKHYTRAPIIEAIIGIETERLPSDKLAVLEPIASRVGYTKLQKVQAYTGHFDITEAPFATGSSEHVGYLSYSADEKHILRVLLGSFIFSRLAPYQDWEHFTAEARRLWAAYREAVGPVKVERFGVRYINKLSIPLGEDLSLYLRTYPEVPKEIPQKLNRHFILMEMPLEELPNGLLVMQQARVELDAPNVASIILDNDLRFQPPSIESDDDLWSRLEAVRREKNRIFEACITDAMRRRIE